MSYLLLLVLSASAARGDIRKALESGDADKAALLAKGHLGKTQADLACTVALLEGVGRFKDAKQLRKKLKAPPPTTAAVTPEQLGKKAFVVASSLSLRAKPTATAPVITRLEIGTPLEVLAIEGEFAKVKTGSSSKPLVVEFEPESGKPTVLQKPGDPEVGYVAAAYLSSSAPDVNSLEKEAESKDLSMQVTALERLASLRGDQATFVKLAGAAFDAGRCGIAVWAANSIREPRVQIGGYVVESFHLVQGCRGDLRSAVIHSPTDQQLEQRQVPGNACGYGIDLDPGCGFCPLGFDDENSPEALTEKARTEKLEATVEMRRAALGELYPKGPYVHARLRFRAPAALELFLVRNEELVQVEGCGEAPPPPRAPRQELQSLEVPQLREGETVELWIALPDFAGWHYGLVTAADAEEAKGSTQGKFETAASMEQNCCCD